MTYVPPASGRARDAARTRRRVRLAIAAAAGCAAVIGALTAAGPVAGVGVQTARVGVIVSDGARPPTSRGSDWGRVTSSPAGIDCPRTCVASFPVGSVVVLRAHPNKGYVFSHWDAAGPASCDMWAPACSLTIEGDELVSAAMGEPTLVETVMGAGKV